MSGFAAKALYSRSTVAVEGERQTVGGRSAGVALQLVAFLGDQIKTFDLPTAGEVTIGRGDENAVRVEEPSVSRQHAVLHVGDALEIEDVGGANGIFMREKARPASAPRR